jgi:hypothetical protein
MHFDACTVSQRLIYGDKKDKVHIEDIKNLNMKEHSRLKIQYNTVEKDYCFQMKKQFR